MALSRKISYRVMIDNILPFLDLETWHLDIACINRASAALVKSGCNAHENRYQAAAQRQLLAVKALVPGLTWTGTRGWLDYDSGGKNSVLRPNFRVFTPLTTETWLCRRMSSTYVRRVDFQERFWVCHNCDSLVADVDKIQNLAITVKEFPEDFIAATVSTRGDLTLGGVTDKFPDKSKILRVFCCTQCIPIVVNQECDIEIRLRGVCIPLDKRTVTMAIDHLERQIRSLSRRANSSVLRV